MITLSKRMQMLADMVTPGGVIADIGTDHGFLPIHLVEKAVCPSAIGMDVNEGPLERAREHVTAAGLTARIDLRLGDGLEKLFPLEASGAIISGMGGSLVLRILSEGQVVVSALDYLILQPQSELKKVREHLADLGLVIVQEEMVEEGGKYYPAMRVEKGQGREYSSPELQYGPLLLRGKNSTLHRFLQKEIKLKEKIRKGLQGKNTPEICARLEEIDGELLEIGKALEYYR